jgi:hypothetical protein
MNKRASVSEYTRLSRSENSKRQASWVLYMVLFFISLTICLLFASKTIVRKTSLPIDYSQNGSIAYKVYLNKNNFYTEDYLEMNKSYVASLINHIDIDFNYNFSMNAKTTINFDYKIIGELVIENGKTSGRYLEKQYVLQDTKVARLIQDKSKNIKENIKIDYAYYNSLANSFRSTYGVDTTSYLNVYMVVTPQVDKGLNYKIDESNKVSLRIPLSEKAIEINLDASSQNINKQIMPSKEVTFNILYLILELVFFIPTCILMVKMISKLLSAFDIYTPYDRYVRKQLKEYDRLIVETNSSLKTRGLNVIDIRSFTELLDARDNLNLPILYLNTIPHKEGVFYILNNTDLYLLKVSNDELEGK